MLAKTELSQSFNIEGQTPEALARALMKELCDGMMQGKSADHDFMKKLIAAGADLSLTGLYGRNPLQLATGMRYTFFIDALIEGKTPLDAQDNEGLTALHLAASICAYRIVGKLLDAGANPMVTDNEGRTPLDHAMDMGANDRAIALLEQAVKKAQDAALEAARKEAAAAAVVQAKVDGYLAEGMPLQQDMKVARQLKLRPPVPA